MLNFIFSNIFLFFLVIPSDAWGFFLSVQSGITSDSTWQTIGFQGSNSSGSIQVKHFTHCAITPAPSFYNLLHIFYKVDNCVKLYK